jgi:hypothetical protein
LFLFEWENALCWKRMKSSLQHCSYGFFPLVVSKFYGRLCRVLGKLHFPVILVAAVVHDIAIEAFFISGLGIWAYH